MAVGLTSKKLTTFLLLFCFVINLFFLQNDIEELKLDYDKFHSQNDDENLSNCLEAQRKRLKFLGEKCQQLKHLREIKPEPEFIHINHLHKTSVCTPHKVGSESWRYFFERLSQRDRNSTEWQSSTNDQLFEDPTHSHIRAYQVRHPLERLLSSYRYVFEQTNLHRTDGLDLVIMEKFGGYQVTEGEIFASRNVTFWEFAQYLIHSEKDFNLANVTGANSHWRTIISECNPCHPRFFPDFIIHLESVINDTLCYLDHVDGIIEEDFDKLILLNINPNSHSSESEVKSKYFSQLSANDIQKLYEVYKYDHLLYDYSIDEYLQLVIK